MSSTRKVPTHSNIKKHAVYTIYTADLGDSLVFFSEFCYKKILLYIQSKESYQKSQVIKTSIVLE